MLHAPPRILHAAAVILAVAALVPARGALAESGHAGREHRSVQIATSGILPERLLLDPDDAVAWSNYSERVAVVVFDENVTEHLLCEGPSNFLVRQGRLSSAPIGRNEFASVCRFEPGTYRYRVELLSEAGASESPATIFEGTLVVKEP